jgi:CubicO group peptidase (beta-lactamase class C family)
VLNRGAWNGKQIVSAAWIEQSIAPHFQAIGYFGGLFFYGYNWWLGRTLSEGKEVAWVAAVGLGGQRIVIVPAIDLVMMVTSGMYTNPRQGNATLDILSSIVMPAVHDKDWVRWPR